MCGTYYFRGIDYYDLYNSSSILLLGEISTNPDRLDGLKHVDACSTVDAINGQLIQVPVEVSDASFIESNSKSSAFSEFVMKIRICSIDWVAEH